MSLQSVSDFLARHAPDIRIVEKDTSTATVAEAATAHGVEPAQIAKTLSLWLKDEVVLLVMGGDTRIDNRKYKDRFGAKAKMLNADEVQQWTGHPVGGVCPFGLPRDLRIFADVSLQKFEEVLPAAGATHAAVRIAPAHLAQLVKAEWVDVAQEQAQAPVPA
ncbi:cys-tRNA(pro)/cys-tRNA(cys) deacylase [Cupriavidus sp. USMAA2-4]|uniref:Cys-tRNA(Pro)/cys-tRNA(Cys) deacylase n=1 Tax=Cupriavidus malaysiensis TaxID=367825 RepID=A0ABM6FFW7_9BURK|nr:MULTISPECIES: YbaK/EbsC family protein [Cupriavidus]AOY97265.1 cys-tRNA(pro)/cys-tRNA(cys) deacylase [Cupriavidus sp. USMAA2-4]AOZ03436.1 cys-tRNA(pro)/cys-tRNA(cys) deacylase [Cupriavidus sp. USMAHM13]AOZ10805.1 cys-tRNA(pro)/cys-tRNA(cys) deacylase [Cupriavidus malaysiensis]